MTITDLLKIPTVDVDVRLSLRVVSDLPLIGKQELVEMNLAGFRDDDGDMKPEFSVTLELLDGRMLNIRDESVEIDPVAVVKAFGGGKDAATSLFNVVVGALKAKGRDISLLS